MKGFVRSLFLLLKKRGWPQYLLLLLLHFIVRLENIMWYISMQKDQLFFMAAENVWEKSSRYDSWGV